MNEQEDKGQDQQLGIGRWIHGEHLPYLQDVLERLPPGVRTEILNDKSLQVIEACGECHPGKFSPFPYPFKNLILIDKDRIKKAAKEGEIFLDEPLSLTQIEQIYFIAIIVHEFAHYWLECKDKINNYDKQADDLAKEWKFKKEIDLFRKAEPQ